MATQIYVNLPVKDVAKSTAFFAHMGYAFDPKFSNDVATCIIVAENIYVMLLAEPFFKTFTKNDVCDARKYTEVLVCLSCETRAAVDALTAKAVAAGGTTPNEPKDFGFMYQNGFQDLDGHTWELMWMDPAGMPAA